MSFAVSRLASAQKCAENVSAGSSNGKRLESSPCPGLPLSHGHAFFQFGMGTSVGVTTGTVGERIPRRRLSIGVRLRR